MASDSNIGTISESFILANDPENSEFIEQLEALQRLRYLKTRETGDAIQIPITSGRDRIVVPEFDKYTYEELAMRRKSEVLKNQNISSQRMSKKQKYSYVSQSKMNQFNQSRINKIDKFISDNPKKSILLPTSNSGIQGGTNDIIYFDPSTPFLRQL